LNDSPDEYTAADRSTGATGSKPRCSQRDVQQRSGYAPRLELLPVLLSQPLLEMREDGACRGTLVDDMKYVGMLG
jgi:hypothetical protein